MRSRPEETKGYLLSSIPFKARLVNRRRLLELLKAYPGLEPVRYGSSLHYLIREEGDGSHFYMVDFGITQVTLQIFARTAPLELLHEGMLRLLNLASFVGEAYDFEIASIFPYLIQVLARQHIEHLPERPERNGKEWAGAEIILAKRIIELRNDSTLLKQQMEYQSDRLVRMLALLLPLRYPGRCSMNQAAKEMGAAKAEIRAAVSISQGAGYRVVWHNEETFSMVWE